MKIRLFTKFNSKIIIYAMIIFVCMIRFLETLGLPHASIFLLDGFNLILLINLIRENKLFKIVSKPVGLFHILILFIGMITSVVNFVEPILVIWALRNILRFEIFFGACLSFLSEEDIKEIIKILKIIFFVNAVLFIGQYALGYRGDFLGGIFGTTTGANSYCNIFFLIICTYETVLWFERKEKTKNFMFYIGFSLVASALCEMKIFFVEIVAIVFFVFFIICLVEKKYKIIVKGIIFTIVGGIALFFGIQLMIKLYPNFANFFTIEGFLYHTTRESGYSGSGDLNRLTAIHTINNKLFNDSSILKIFGMGLGSTEYSTSISFLASNFYQGYKYLHYYWLSHAWMYLECGLIGLVGYIMGFIATGFVGTKEIKKLKNEKRSTEYAITGVVISFLCIILYLYNQSLRLECAYLLYFCLAAIFIGGSKKNV